MNKNMSIFGRSIVLGEFLQLIGMEIDIHTLFVLHNLIGMYVV